MNVEIPKEAIWSAIGFVLAAFLAWVLGLKKKQEEVKDSTIRELQLSMDENSGEQMKLRFAIQSLEKAIQPIPKMQQDINEAHTKIRELKAGMSLTDRSL